MTERGCSDSDSIVILTASIESDAACRQARSSLIDKLELLLALSKERHFGRAAEACGVTQPTMSTSLKQLEEILGVMLVQRGSRFQGFTPGGRAHAGLGAPHRRRRPRDEAGNQRAEGQALRRDPDRSHSNGIGHDGIADHPVPGASSGCAFSHRVLHLHRGAGAVGKSRSRCRADLSGERAGRQGALDPALQRNLSSGHLAGRHVRRPRPGDVAGGRPGAAVPA